MNEAVPRSARSDSAIYDGQFLVVQGTLDSTPSTPLSITLYASAGPGRPGGGDAEVALGWQAVTTDAAGHASFAAVLPKYVPAGYHVTAIVRWIASEPSAAVPVVVAGPAPGTDAPGVYAAGTGAWFLRNSASAGGADLVFSYGGGGALVAL